MSTTTENTLSPSELPSIGQLERQISQAIQKLWKEKTGRFPEPAISLFFERKLVIWLGNVLTPLTQMLSVHPQASSQERKAIDQIMKQEVYQCLQDILSDCAIESVLIDTDPERNCTGILVMLDKLPAVRNVESVPKLRV